MRYSFSELFCPPSALIIAVSASAGRIIGSFGFMSEVCAERWRGKAPWLSDGRCVSGTEMATCLWPSSAEVVCRQQREKKQSEEESEVGETNGDPGFKGTTPTEPLRYNSANETLEPWLWPEDVSRRRREWELKMQEAGELLTVNARTNGQLCRTWLKTKARKSN